jgi:peptidoglycan/xylan/chitin deacetylase (PgdA/CDA1 family)
VTRLRRWANVVPLRSALDDLAAGRPLPPRAVALTFDDGYLDNATFAGPVLAAAGLPATFFLVPGFLDGAAPAWWETLGWALAHTSATTLVWDGQRYDVSVPPARAATMDAVTPALKAADAQVRADAVAELRQRLRPDGPALGRLFMDWDEADKLTALGLDIGSHTCGHPILGNEQPEVQAQELSGSRRALDDHFQRPVDVLAFPNGKPQDYTEVTLDLARQAGYAFAVTTRRAFAEPGVAPHEVPRVMVDAGSDVRGLLRAGLRRAAGWVRPATPHR